MHYNSTTQQYCVGPHSHRSRARVCSADDQQSLNGGAFCYYPGKEANPVDVTMLRWHNNCSRQSMHTV